MYHHTSIPFLIFCTLLSPLFLFLTIVMCLTNSITSTISISISSPGPRRARSAHSVPTQVGALLFPFPLDTFLVFPSPFDSFRSLLFLLLPCHRMPPLAGRSTSNNGRCVSQDLFSTCSTTVSLVPAISYQSLSSQTLESQDNGLCPALRCPPQGQMGGHNKHLRRQWRDRGREPQPFSAPECQWFGRMLAAAPDQASSCFLQPVCRLPLCKDHWL